jgi:hypothetical protein
MATWSRGSRGATLTALLLALLALTPAAACATYTGVQDTATLGTLAVGAGWIAVPQYTDNYNPEVPGPNPLGETTDSLWIARVAGPRFITFKTAAAPYSATMGPMLVAGAANTLAAAWSDVATPGRVESGVLGAGGKVSLPLVEPGVPSEGSLRIAVGPDGARALSWRDGGGLHLTGAPAGAQQLGPLFGPGVALDPSARVLLSGGSTFWLLDEAAGAITAAPAVFGQVSAPQAVRLSGVKVTALGDGAGGLWALARASRGWFAAHVDRAGHVGSTGLPAGAAGAAIALVGSTAVIAYRAGPHCATYIERLTPFAPHPHASRRTRLTRASRTCSTPAAIAVDRGSGAAYVLLRSPHATTLVRETAAGATSTWSAPLTEHVDAMVAAGSDRVAIESNGPQRSVGEQCGGAGPSYSQSYFVRIFHGLHPVRTGRLEGSTLNC